MKSYMEQVHDDIEGGVFQGEYLDTPVDPYKFTAPECGSGFIAGVVVGAILF